MVQATTKPTPGWPPDDADEPTRLVLALFRVVRGAQARSHSPVDLGSRRLLGTLAQTGPIRLSELARESQLDLSTVSRHVTGLAAEGLLQREADPADRRACVVGLTQSGRQRLHELVTERAAALAPLLDRWSADDRDRLVTLLTRLADDLQPVTTGKDAS